MKKIFIPILIVALCMILLLCIIFSPKSKYKVSNDLVSMSVKEGTLTNTSATVVLVNHTDKKFQYGRFYLIESKKNGNWYKIKPISEMNFPWIAYILNPYIMDEVSIIWKKAYGELPSGDYRIIKILEEFNEAHPGRTNNYEEIPIAAEFTIK